MDMPYGLTVRGIIKNDEEQNAFVLDDVGELIEPNV